MTVNYTSRSSRRSRLTVFKMKLNKFHSPLITTHRIKISRKRISKPKTILYRISTWMNRWILVHSTMMFICILIYYWPSLINSNAIVFQSNNKTLIKHEYFNWTHYDWCSSSRLLNNTSSYAVVNQYLIPLGAIWYVTLIIGFLLYFISNGKLTNDSSSNFWYGLFILGMFVASSISNQLISSLICRPVEILYDKGFRTIIGVQIIGFITCVHFTYGLGCVFTPLLDQRKTTSFKLDRRTPLFSSVDSIPGL